MYYRAGDNSKFEYAALRILLLRDPECGKILFKDNYNFASVYAYALGIASVVHDYRIFDAILYKKVAGVDLAEKSNYMGTDEDNLKKFFEYFNDSIAYEVRRYDCKNKLLLSKLDFSHEQLFLCADSNEQDGDDELVEMLEMVEDGYKGFVPGILAAVRHSVRKRLELKKYIKENPMVRASEIVHYVMDELGFVEDAHVSELERYVDFGMEFDEDNYDSLGKWLRISVPKTGYGLFSKEVWTSDELLPILEKYV